MKKIILFIVAFILFIGSAEAISFKTGSYISNSYIKKVKDGRTYYMQSRFIYDQDGRVVYCLEPFVDIQTSGINYKAYYGDYEKYTSLSAEQWDRVMLLSYYGYGYGDHTDAKWYGITQFMIWKTVDIDHEIFFTNKLNGNKVEKYNSEMEELEQLIKYHKITPSFPDTLTVNYKEKIFLKDTNNVLGNYNLKDYSQLKVSKENNTLILEANICANNQKIDFVKEDSHYDVPVVVYIHDTAQNTLGVGSYEPLTYSINVDVSCSRISLDIADISDVYSSQKEFIVTYGLYDSDNNLLETITTDKPGKYLSELLPVGDYYIKQQEVGTGYIKDNNVYHVSLQDGKLEEVRLENEALVNQINITKYFGSKDCSVFQKELGAVFEVVDIFGNVVDTFITDASGSLSFKLGYGEYNIIQTHGINNYSLVENLELSIKEDGKNHDFELYNYLEMYKLEIRLVDEQDNLIKDNASLTIDEIHDIENGTVELELPFGEYEFLLEKIIGYESPESNLITFDLNTPKVLVDGEEIYVINIQLKTEKFTEENGLDTEEQQGDLSDSILGTEEKIEDIINDLKPEESIIVENPNTSVDKPIKLVIILLISLFIICFFSKIVQKTR